MLINSHYPQVPISTSNVATDLARIDNQQKPPLLPPQEPSKGHEERAYNQNNERAPADVIKQKQQQEQQQNASLYQQKVSTQTAAAPVVAKAVRIIANNKAALERKDIHVKQPAKEDQKETKGLANHPSLQGQSSSFYQQLGQQVEQFYQAKVSPQSLPTLSISI
ncbi:conserved hypothetical protein [Shewanella denitrificans OS217]|jgi:hypothetical protein|uniref:Uncharacterized protein n=1 Tax=Shewanella denitrificans (strain OS217 / ATCC BAA-1090 / DSM 15013) TaxID=318161 RepID=Q12I90_SHEDO|nr:hypothetical protein [Shewanella denitrificans]ABE56836.1 conserved hypothetical protein [Shewanella denitrificans OS217]